MFHNGLDSVGNWCRWISEVRRIHVFEEVAEICIEGTDQIFARFLLQQCGRERESFAGSAAASEEAGQVRIGNLECGHEMYLESQFGRQAKGLDSREAFEILERAKELRGGDCCGNEGENARSLAAARHCSVGQSGVNRCCSVEEISCCILKFVSPPPCQSVSAWKQADRPR